MELLAGVIYYLSLATNSHLILHRLSTTRATLIALFCTVFEIFDVPVYWPILVCYFLALFAMTMRRQIQYVSGSCCQSISDLTERLLQTYGEI